MSEITMVVSKKMIELFHQAFDKARKQKIDLTAHDIVEIGMQMFIESFDDWEDIFEKEPQNEDPT